MLKLPLLLSLLFTVLHTLAQSDMDTLHHRKIFVTSGLGWGFAVGETSDVLQAKFSNSLGLDIGLANKHYFVYPSIDFLSFAYNQRIRDPDYAYELEKGRSNFYMLNLAGGVRKQLDKLNIYAYAGPGVGVVVEPRAAVSTGQNKVTIENTSYLTPSLRGGVGADYRIGGFFLFIETGWLHTFRHMQERQVNVMSLYGGLKTDVTKLRDNVIRVIGGE
ncbi:hypothetical protein [Parapedobacter sp. DT-150]|uniref:hypothetical protein n=1 Tax=Parapedobacter sp. DT-150 TaxID=3396162 RepID=UPI003F1B1EB6